MASSNEALADKRTELLLHAYVDGELDVASSLAVERTIQADSVVANEVATIMALQKSVREKLPLEPIPPHLKSRIDSLISPRRSHSRPSWSLLAASVVTAIALTGSSTWWAVQTRGADPVVEGLLDSHIRALGASQPFDIVSSDKHTVKPWFNGRIPQSPRVIDLAAQGFPLAGGRIDVVNRNAVPTLVYSKDRHLISVSSVLSQGTEKPPVAQNTASGFNIVTWRDDASEYWAISDLNKSDLTSFAKLFQKSP